MRKEIEETYMILLEDVYSDSTATIKLYKNIGNIPIKKEVRQKIVFPPDYSQHVCTKCLRTQIEKFLWLEQFEIPK